MKDTFIKKLDFNKQFKNYCLTPKEDAEFMANIDIEALERGVEKSEEDIANGRVIEFREAMAQIHKEVFDE